MPHEDQASPARLVAQARLHPSSLVRNEDENLAVYAGCPDGDLGTETGVLDCIRRCLMGREDDVVTDLVRYLYPRKPRSELSTQAA